MNDLSYLNTEYARNKMIEEYNTPYVPKEAKMKTGKEIVDDWRGQSTRQWLDLEDKIDAALQAARTEGEIAGAKAIATIEKILNISDEAEDEYLFTHNVLPVLGDYLKA